MSIIIIIIIIITLDFNPGIYTTKGKKIIDLYAPLGCNIVTSEFRGTGGDNVSVS